MLVFVNILVILTIYVKPYGVQGAPVERGFAIHHPGVCMIFDNLTAWGVLIAFAIGAVLSYLVVRASDDEN